MNNDLQDLLWKNESLDSGKKYGFPECCIAEFVALPPSKMKQKSPTAQDKLRFEMAKVDGKFSGFVPCLKHAQMIRDKKITLESLIDYKKRMDPAKFPHGGLFK